MTVFGRLCLLAFNPFPAEEAEKVVSKKIVEWLTGGRKVNSIAYGHHLVVLQLRRDNRPPQSLLLLAPHAERVDLFNALINCRLELAGMQRQCVHGEGAVTSFIFLAAPAGAGLISSNIRHVLAFGVSAISPLPHTII